MSVVIGCDPHKKSHTAVAVDASTGAVLGERTVPATERGHLELLSWGRDVGCQVRWAIEDCRHVSRRLQQLLLSVGEDVVGVPPKMMAGTRRSAR